MRVESVPAADQAAEHRVGGLHEFDQQEVGGQLAGEGKNFFDRDALGYQHVVDYSEHHHHIEGAVRTFEKRRALAIAPAERGSGAAQVDYEGQDIQLLFRSSLPDASDDRWVGIDGDYACAGEGGEFTEVSGVGADVEYAAGMKFAKYLRDEGLFCGELLGTVVGLGREIFRPVRIFVSRVRHALELAAQTAEHRGQCEFGALGIGGSGAIETRVRFGTARKPSGNRDERQSRTGQPAGPGKRSINLFRLQSIAMGEPYGCGRCVFGKKREQEGANELGVGGPEAKVHVAAFERKHVDKDGRGSAEQHVVGTGVLQEPFMSKAIVGQIEGEESGGGKHLARPFGGKTRKWDAFMLGEMIIRWKFTYEFQGVGETCGD